MKRILYTVLLISIFLLCFTGCSGSSTTSGYGSDGYSDAYHTDAGYRKTVDDISGMTGDSHKEVDKKIDAMTRAINGE